MEMMLTMNILAMEANNSPNDGIVGSRGIPKQTNDKYNVNQDGLLNDCLMIDRRTMFRLLGWCVAYFTLPRGNSSAKAL